MNGAPALKVLALATAAGVSVGLFALGTRSPLRERGAELFHGDAALSGRLRGHDEPLPPETVRCGNCHALESNARSAADRGDGLVESAGPVLGRRALTRTAERRGGPPSRYTLQSFCRLLRDGVDPSRIVIVQLMPRYDLDDEDCGALWTYLTSR